MIKSTNSKFITISSWYLIITSAILILITLLLNIVYLFKMPNFNDYNKNSFIQRIIFLNPRLSIFILFIIFIYFFIASIFLLKRKNWARISIIILLILSILFWLYRLYNNILYLYFIAFDDYFYKNYFNDLKGFIVLRSFTSIIFICLIIFFILIIIKLSSKKNIVEFKKQ